MDARHEAGHDVVRFAFIGKVPRRRFATYLSQ